MRVWADSLSRRSTSELTDGKNGMSSLFDLTGKVALITGSTKGIGKAIAERMSEHGAKVVISSRKADACEEVAAELRAKGGEAFAKAANVVRSRDLAELHRAAVAHYDHIAAGPRDGKVLYQIGDVGFVK